jgi:glutathione S-transferase
MAFSYVSVEEAIASDGLRMVVVGGVPSPWGEAAKGILHVKGIEWKAVRLDYDSEGLKQWAGARNGPVAIYDGERPRDRWNDILLLAERLAPRPALLPADTAQRALVFGLAHEICGEEGLCWSRRNQLVHMGLTGAGGFPERGARYLARKYGYRPEMAKDYARRVVGLLQMLARRLESQRTDGSDYLVGDTLTAADIYCATALAIFAPLPEAVCAMDATMRTVFSTRDETSKAGLDPILFAHRDRIYERHLERPLSL